MKKSTKFVLIAIEKAFDNDLIHKLYKNKIHDYLLGLICSTKNVKDISLYYMMNTRSRVKIPLEFFREICWGRSSLFYSRIKNTVSSYCHQQVSDTKCFKS